MAPGRKRGGKGAKEKSQLSLGDLVLAKVKGFPAWPAKISRPEDWERAPDSKKYFVQFFGTAEIAFVAPADIQAFTSESQKKLSARCQGKTVKYFAQAVKEICEEFDVLQQKKISNIRDDNNAQDLASEAHAADPVADEALEVSADDEREGPKCKLEIDRLSDGSSEFGRSQKKGAMGFQDVKPCLSGDINHSSPALSPGKKSKLSSTPSKRVKGSVLPSVSSSHASVKEEVSHNVKVEGGCSDGGQSGMANNRHQSKLAMGLKRKREGTVQMKYASDGNMKVSFADNLKLDSDLGSGKKIKKFLKEKKHSVAVDGRVYAKVISEEHNEVPSKKMNFQHDHEKLTSPTIEASCPAKISKSVNIVDGANMVRAQTSRKSGPISPVDIDRKMVDKESKRLTSGGKAENHQSFRADKSTNVSNHPTAEYDPPPTERHCLTGGMMSNSALISENINGNSASCRSGLATPNKVRPSGMQLLTKRRAVRLCDDDDDELPKTPIHGGVSHKASAIPHVTDSKNKTVKRGEGCANDRLVSRKLGIIGNALKEQVISTQSSKKTSSPTVQKGMDKRTRETSAEHVSPNQCQLDSKKSPFMEAKSATDLTLSVTAARPLAEPQKKNLSKTPVSISQKKVPSGANRSLNTAFDGSSLDQSINERSKPPSPGEKRKATPLSDSQINDSDISVGNPDENFIALGERLNVGNDSKTSFTVNSKISDSVTSMKHLIAAAQARKKQAHLQNAYTNHFPLVLPDADMLGRSPSSTPVESNQNFQLDVQRLHPNPPSSDVRQLSSANEHENGEFDERRVSSGHQATGSSLSGDTEAAVARDAFEGMIETLSRTKESIGRATRLAIDCAKYGIANEVVELLIRKLENEPSLHRKVDLFFLFDSITQCSHNQKGIAGASYLPIIQAALPRLIGAAAPPGTGAHENRRQCHKVLRLWLERKILPESVLRRYMDDIGTRNDETSTGVSHKRPSRAERAIDDPIRDMEGMLVDEYGSNATFQLAGLLPSHFFYEEEDEDESSFPKQHKKVGDTSPSEHHTPANRDPDICTVTPSDRRHCILEDVDGELEMEDVSAHQKDEEPFSTNDTAWVALHEPNSGGIFQSASSMSEFLPSPEGSPPLPPGSPPGTPPLPTSPPPPPPPPSSPSPPLLPPTLLVHHLFPPPPPPPVFLSEQSLPPQPALMPQRMPPLPPTISSQPVTYYPPPLPHEIGGTPTVNQHVHMVSNTHGSRIDAPVRGEVYSQQSSFFSPAAVSNVRELVGYNSLRLVEYGQSDGYVNRQAPQQTQPFRPGSAPLAQRPLHPEQMTQIPSHFSYPNTAQQNLYLPYSVPSFPDGLRRNTTDDQWRMQGNELSSDDSRREWVTRGRSCSGPPYSHEGYFGGPLERPTTNVVSFQPSAANSIPAAQISAHGSHVMPSRADVSAVSWRPA